MIVVIQCAATKSPQAGYLKDASENKVMFVAQPGNAPETGHKYARPDDMSDFGIPWRNVLLQYNAEPNGNSFGLYPAYRLYENRTYECLVERFGLDRVFILSAGWGLISAGFLTPQYDITFSQSAQVEAFKRRGRREGTYADFQMLPEDADNVVFLGGKDYLPLFCKLTRAVRGQKTVFYNSKEVPAAPGCRLKRFHTTTRTNWQYECALALIDGMLKY